MAAGTFDSFGGGTRQSRRDATRRRMDDSAIRRGAEADDDAERALVQQIDTLQKLSQYERQGVLGENFFTQLREFYSLLPGSDSTLPFRPGMRIPYLQMLGIMESVDLAALEPRVYLVRPSMKVDQGRDKARELYFQAQYRQSYSALHLFFGILWSYFAGTAFMQVAWDKRAAGGQGDATVRWRDPETVYPDPYAYNDEEWRFVLWEDYMWLDEVIELWGAPAYRVRPRFGSGEPGLPGTQAQNSLRSSTTQRSPFDYVAGPLRSIGGMPHTTVAGDGRVRVRTLFVRDSTLAQRGPRKGGKAQLSIDAMPEPDDIPLYPRGRYIVECEGVILNPGIEDQQNPRSDGQFPLVRLCGLPPLTAFWAPPPIRFSLNLQEGAERWLAQVYENGSRINNAMAFIPQDSGIAEDQFGGVPGEFHMVNPNSKPIQFVWGQPLPEYMVKMPELLLNMQDRIQGFSPQRLGNMTAGNISAPQFEAAVAQSGGLTRMRAMLLKPAVQRLELLRFNTMAQHYMTPRVLPDPGVDDIGYVSWTPLNDMQLALYQLVLDPASIEPMSQTSMKLMVPLLSKLNVLDPQSVLETLQWPNAREVLQRLDARAKAQTEARMAEKNAGRKK